MAGRDSVPAGGVPVVLHRISRDSSVRADSVLTGPEGRFSFELPVPPDSGVVLVAVARYGGVEYPGPALHGEIPSDPYRISVFESRSEERPDTLRIARRTLIVVRGERGLDVADLVEVANPTDRTLVAPARDTLWWGLGLPASATDVELLPGAPLFSRAAVGGETVRLTADIPPGGVRVPVAYRIPLGKELRVRSERPTDHVLVMVEAGGGPALEVEGVTPLGSSRFHGREFRQFEARGLRPGDVVTVRRESGSPPGSPAPWIFLGTGVALAVAAWSTWRRGHDPAAGRRGGPDGSGETGP